MIQDSKDLILEEKEKISTHFKIRIKKLSSFYQKRVDYNTSQFEKRVKKISKENEAALNVLIGNYDKKLRKLVLEKANFAALRKKVIFEICDYFGLEVEDVINSKRQNRGKTDCMMLIYYFLYYHKMGTLREIGEEVHRERSSVCMGIATVENFIKVDKVFHRHFKNLSNIIDDLIEEANKVL